MELHLDVISRDGGTTSTAIELSRGITEISKDPDKGACIQIRTPLNSPALGAF